MEPIRTDTLAIALIPTPARRLQRQVVFRIENDISRRQFQPDQRLPDRRYAVRMHALFQVCQ